MPTKIRCPKCLSPNIARIPIGRQDWRPGEHRCNDCNFHDAWGLFLDPPLQFDVPFADALPEEKRARHRGAASIAAFDMLIPIGGLSERAARHLPEKATLKALARGDVTVDELVASFRESLEVAVEAERKRG